MATWDGTLHDTSLTSLTTYEAGATLQLVSGTATGDFSACTAGWFGDVYVAGADARQPNWSMGVTAQFPDGIFLTQEAGNPQFAAGGHLTIGSECEAASGPVAPPDLTVHLVFQWAHPYPRVSVN